MCSDSSSVDNEALAVNVLLPGTLQGRNLLQMLEAGVQLGVGISAREAKLTEKWMGHTKARTRITCATCHQATINLQFLWHSGLTGSYCSNIGDNI